jgi:plasmid maintenance system antidote protein VapI
MARKSARIINPHPDEILMEEFLKPMALSQTALARAIGDKLNAITPGAA